MVAAQPEFGVVARFDAAAGVGTILVDDGSSIDFHCVALADGSRHTTEGRRVSFLRRLGPTGRPEAIGITER